MKGKQTAACSSEGRPSAASDNEVRAGPHALMHATFCCRLSVLCLLALWSILHPSRSFCFGRLTAVSRAVLFARAYFCRYNVLCATSGSQPTIVSACFSMLHTIVMLDTAWPWASEAYGLCRLCAHFCAHKLICARSYGFIVLQIVCYKVNSGAGYCLALGQ